MDDFVPYKVCNLWTMID